MICEYKNKPCKFWNPDDFCTAADPSQCPHNTPVDLRVVQEWQINAMKAVVKGGEKCLKK